MRIFQGQCRVEQDLDQKVTQETGPQPVLIAQGVADHYGQLPGKFGKSPGIVKSGVFIQVPPHSAGHCRRHRIGIGQKRLDVLDPQSHPAIGDRQPIGHAGAGREIRPVQQRQGVGKVIHKFTANIDFIIYNYAEGDTIMKCLFSQYRGFLPLMTLLIGIVLGGFLPHIPLHAVATDRGETYIIATGLLDTDVEAVYFLDCLTGDLFAARP